MHEIGEHCDKAALLVREVDQPALGMAQHHQRLDKGQLEGGVLLLNELPQGAGLVVRDIDRRGHRVAAMEPLTGRILDVAGPVLQLDH